MAANLRRSRFRWWLLPLLSGVFRSIHLPSNTTTTTVSADDNENDVPVMDDPTIDAKHGNITECDPS